MQHFHFVLILYVSFVSLLFFLAVLVCCTFTCMHGDHDVACSRFIQNWSHFMYHPRQGYELNSLVLMFTGYAAATAQQMPVPGEGDVPVTVTIEPELSLGELTQVWDAGSRIRQGSWPTEGVEWRVWWFRRFCIQVLELVVWASRRW